MTRLVGIHCRCILFLIFRGFCLSSLSMWMLCLSSLGLFRPLFFNFGWLRSRGGCIAVASTLESGVSWTWMLIVTSNLHAAPPEPPKWPLLARLSSIWFAHEELWIWWWCAVSQWSHTRSQWSSNPAHPDRTDSSLADQPQRISSWSWYRDTTPWPAHYSVAWLDLICYEIIYQIMTQKSWVLLLLNAPRNDVNILPWCHHLCFFLLALKLHLGISV